MQLGWADESFTAIADEGKGCGDDQHSWAYDGMRGLKWHSNNKEQYGRRWKAGDMICMALSLEDGEISFGLNGDWEGEMGCAFSGVTFEGAVYPCLSLMRGERVQINLGTETNPFVHSPPERVSSSNSDTSIRRFRDWIQQVLQLRARYSNGAGRKQFRCVLSRWNHGNDDEEGVGLRG